MSHSNKDVERWMLTHKVVGPVGPRPNGFKAHNLKEKIAGNWQG